MILIYKVKRLHKKRPDCEFFHNEHRNSYQTNCNAYICRIQEIIVYHVLKRVGINFFSIHQFKFYLGNMNIYNITIFSIKTYCT